MNQVLSNRWLLLAARFVLGMVFLMAAVPKVAKPELFAAHIEAYEMLPTMVINLLAIAIPWLELVCGILLIGGARLRPAASILGFLLCLFIVAIVSAVLRGLHIDCGCFGEEKGTIVGWGKVVEDVALLVPAWLLARRPAAERPAPDLANR